MKTPRCSFLVLLLSFWTATAGAQAIGARWDAPSKLTPAQATDVFYRKAAGRAVTVSELFEAEKYLRTDAAVSVGTRLLQDALRRLLDERLYASGSDVRIRMDPVLQWLETTRPSADVVRLRGESVVLTVLNTDPNLAATVIVHDTIHKEYRVCGSVPCATLLPTAVRSTVAYELEVPLESAAPAEARSSELVLATGFKGRINAQTVPSGDQSGKLGPACDPLPSSTRFTPDGQSDVRMFFVHLGRETKQAAANQLLCAFFAIPEDDLSRFTYRTGTALAGPPTTAARSATRTNPIDFPMFQ